MICYVSNVPIDTNTHSFRSNTPEVGCLIRINVFDEKDRNIYHKSFIWDDQDVEDLIGTHLYTEGKVYWEYIDPDYLIEVLNVTNDV